MALIDLGLDVSTDVVIIKSVSVLCLYMLRNTKATFKAQFIKKLSNTEAELKKSVAYKKKRVMQGFPGALVIESGVSKVATLQQCFRK